MNNRDINLLFLGIAVILLLMIFSNINSLVISQKLTLIEKKLK